MITEKKLKQIQRVQLEELRMQQETQLEEYRKRPDGVNPDSMWLVVYECRYNVIRVSPLGDGFFAPGQEPCWRFDNVTEWIQEIKPPADDLSDEVEEVPGPVGAELRSHCDPNGWRKKTRKKQK